MMCTWRFVALSIKGRIHCSRATKNTIITRLHFLTITINFQRVNVFIEGNLPSDGIKRSLLLYYTQTTSPNIRKWKYFTNNSRFPTTIWKYVVTTNNTGFIIWENKPQPKLFNCRSLCHAFHKIQRALSQFAVDWRRQNYFRHL